uniref:ATP synthase subunit a n=1 Tax=Hoplopleura sp. TaxID=2782173 RepID=A0A7S8WWD3_9NEOP|nr:ATP synthase F0 subunit 6 [Hoplopleura sp.]
MMPSMMSVFDPSSSLLSASLPLKVLVQIALIILSNWLWPAATGFMVWVKSCYAWSKNMGFSLLLCWLFQFILFTNLTGMLPLTYSYSSSLQFSLGLSTSLWLGGILYSMSASVEKVLAHLCPEGVEAPMSLFLVAIELVSLIIRPMSLGIRLMANMTAGHMIMALCESGCVLCGSGLLTSTLSLSSLCTACVYEMAVAVIQAYIFVSLISLYWEEY